MLFELIHINLINQLKEYTKSNNDSKEYNRLLSITARGSSIWINTIPSLPYQILNDNHYRLATRLRYGLPPNDSIVTRCSHSNCKGNPSTDPWHCLTCIYTKKHEITLRHDQVNMNLQQFSQQANILTRLEPSGLAEDDKKRPDLLLLMDNQIVLVDVTICHPTHNNNNINNINNNNSHNNNYLSSSSVLFPPQPFTQLNQRIKAKLKKYKSLTDKHGANFSVFACETYGGFSSSSEQLIERIARFAHEHQSAWTSEELLLHLKSSVSIAIQRGNAMAAISSFRAYIPIAIRQMY